jgi:hypothetical protein
MSSQPNTQPAVVNSGDDESNELLRAHQAILDAWYDRWTSAHRDYAAEVVASMQRKGDAGGR